jgi:hypothetical protein
MNFYFAQVLFVEFERFSIDILLFYYPCHTSFPVVQ